MSLRYSMLNFIRQVILGPSYFYHKSLITRSKKWDDEKVKLFQSTKTVSRIKKFGNNVKTKKDYLNNVGRYTSFGGFFLSKTMRTGGTTGTPFVFKMDRFFTRQRERAYIFDIWNEVGFKPFDLRVIFRGNLNNHLISYNWFENAWVISPQLINSSNKLELYEFLVNLDAFFLHVYPSSLVTFIDLFKDGDFRALPIKGVLAGSEAFPIEQMKLFESKYGLPIAHWYGHSEYATLARFCRDCTGFHFYPTYGYTEFVNVETSRCNGAKNIVVTSYNKIGTQFVRYDTGDLATLSSNPCKKPFLVAANIQGRSQEFFIDNEGNTCAFGPYLFGIHNEFWDLVSKVQFIQIKVGELTVKLVTKERSDSIWLESYLSDRFNNVELEFDYVEQIPVTAAGKHRYYINELDKGLVN